MKPIATLLFLLFYTITIFGQTALEYTLSKGNVFTIKQNATQVITQEIAGSKHELTNAIDGILEFKVLAQQEDNYQIALTFKDLNLYMTSNMQGELMNVKAKEVSEDDIQSQIFNILLNNPVQMTLSKTGDIIEVVGGDSLVVKMTNASGLEDDFSKNMIKKSLEKEFSSEALSNNYKQMTFIYSEKKVDVGDTWQNEYSGKLNVKNTWTLDDITERNAIITGKSDVIINIAEPATTMKLNGTQEAKITTDILSGFIIKMQVEGFSEGTSTSVQMGDLEIPTSIKSTTTYELIKK